MKSHINILILTVFLLENLSILCSSSNIFTEDYLKSTHWGTYKPNLYFSIREKSPKTFTFGLMWYLADVDKEDSSNKNNIRDRIRHECNMKHENITYNWLIHDGNSIAEEEIQDKDLNLDLNIKYIKTSHDQWSSLIEGSKSRDNRLGFVLYSALENYEVEEKSIFSSFSIKIHKENEEEYIIFTTEHKVNGKIRGYITYKVLRDHIESYSVQKYRKKYEDTWKVKTFVSVELNENEALLKSQEKVKKEEEDEEGDDIYKEYSKIYSRFNKQNSIKAPNIVALQLIFKQNFKIQVEYNSKQASDIQIMNDSFFINQFNSSKERFINRIFSIYKVNFESFSYIPPSQKQTFQKFILTSVSNIFGGIGYFYGEISLDSNSVSQISERELIEITSEKYLLTGTPSRSFFPRGFLWDEGFHNTIISDFDMNLSMEIISSWLSTMSSTGYIAREQIRGREQMTMSDIRFMSQNINYANPPTFIFTIGKILDTYILNYVEGETNTTTSTSQIQIPSSTSLLSFLNNTFNKLNLLYTWYERTQKVNGNWIWNGRNSEHNLPSGMDDLPRGFNLNNEERHIDLYIWMIELLKCLRRLSEVVNPEYSNDINTKLFNLESNFSLLYKDNDLKIFNDYLGPQFKLIQTKKFPRPVFPISWRGDNKCGNPNVNPNPINAPFSDCNPYSQNNCCSEYGWCGKGSSFCDCEKCKKSKTLEERGVKTYPIFSPHIGYNTLFPLMFGLINEDSEEFDNIIKYLSDENELMSKYGVRSLSKSDLLYHVGEDYWRGNIWININYLVLRGLKTYYKNNDRSKEIYNLLRNRLIQNIFSQWTRIGMFNEQYCDITGNGIRAKPFNGWTSLIVKIIAENYN